MMDASMRKYSSFAWNFNKQNKGSARKFHMLDNYSASDRFDFKLHKQHVGCCWVRLIALSNILQQQ